MVPHLILPTICSLQQFVPPLTGEKTKFNKVKTPTQGHKPIKKQSLDSNLSQHPSHQRDCPLSWETPESQANWMVSHPSSNSIGVLIISLGSLPLLKISPDIVHVVSTISWGNVLSQKTSVISEFYLVLFLSLLFFFF